MRKLAIALAAACFAAASPPPTDNGTPKRSFVVKCGKLYTGTNVHSGAWMVIRDGRIERIGGIDDVATEQMPRDLPVLDATDKVVMPGIVAADSFLSGQRDTDYNVTPDFVALDGFDFEREFRSALSGGVTTVFLGNGRQRLISGQGSVVKLFGENLVERTLNESCALQVTFGAESTRSPFLFEPTLNPSDDDPLGPARQQYPSARISQLSTLRDVFAEAQLGGDTLRGEGLTENHYDPEALRRAASGQLPLRISVREASDILRALRFAKRMGSARVTLENPHEVDKVAARIARSGAHVVFRVPVAISSRNPGGENRRSERSANRPENAAIAAAAGIPFALAPDRDSSLADFLFVAGIAIRHGLSTEHAMRAITVDAAKTLGVDSEVGSLEEGKHADFLVLSGDPFAVGTMVEKTFVDGVPAYERKQSEDLIAIRASRVITAAGPVLRDGTVIVGNGKIKAVGEELAVPYGARLIELPDAVITPGFINAFTSIGLSGDGTGIPNGTLDQRVADVVQHDDKMFAEALGAGLTTVLVAGPDGRAVSGRVAAIKTGAANQASHVVRDIAALRIVHDVIGPDSTKALKSLVDRGKKYIESWKKYEKALAEWEKGKKAEATKEAKSASEDDPVTGTWECEISDLPIPVSIEITLRLQLEGETVTGTVEASIDGQQMPQKGKIENGRFKDGRITGQATVMGNSADVDATVADDRLEGTMNAMGQEAVITGERTSKSTAGDADEDEADEDDGKPKAPNVDESLEPVKSWIEGKVPAVIRTTRAPAIKDVISFFEKEKLAFVLSGVRDAVETPNVLGEKPPPVLLGPTLVRREKGEVVNAAAKLADSGVALAFGTGDTAGCRYLPLHAAHAIRWGLDPQAALHALTIDPAKMFKIDDRVGSLERGKDADLVVFSGNPFEMTSRVLLVVCNGRIVVDERSSR